MIASTLRRIDEEKLETDLAYRMQFVMEFMDFGERDIDAIHAAAPVIAPLVDGLVDAVYVKLFTYDATKRHFVQRNDGFNGEAPTGIDALTMDHAQIQFRKQHLKNYLVKLVTAPYDGKMLGYLDFVGKIHTSAAGSRDLQIPLIQVNALMGFVSTALTTAILGLELDAETKRDTVAAFTKLLWIQNDLFERWYVN